MTDTESKLEAAFLKQWKKTGAVNVVLQYKFHSKRSWRFDFAWPEYKLAVEIQGFGPGHNTYSGMSKDYEKHNHAVIAGWKIIYLMGYQLTNKKIEHTVQYINAVLVRVGKVSK